MPPYKDGTYVIGEYVERISDIKLGKVYLLITRTDFIFKRIESINKKSITVKSNESFYENYEIPFSDLWEIWQHAGSYSPQELEIIDFASEDVKSMLLRLMQEIKELKAAIKN
ncbi:hypothetical protein D3C78_1658910 [compost metagenome]